jgi:hypothetical protein
MTIKKVILSSLCIISILQPAHASSSDFARKMLDIAKRNKKTVAIALILGYGAKLLRKTVNSAKAKKAAMLAIPRPLNDQNIAWHKPTDKDATTIFYQGIESSQVQAAKYTEKLIATTGETVESPTFIPLIQYPFIGEEISEVQLGGPHEWLFNRDPFSLKTNLQFLFFKWSQGVTIKPTEEGTKTLQRFTMVRTKISFGQEEDIACYTQKLNAFNHSNQKANDLIAFGVSRGAVATFNAVSNNAFQNEKDKLKMVVLEGCFDSLENVLASKFPKSGTFVHRLLDKILPAYSTDHSKSPMGNATEFANQSKKADGSYIPVVFITSKADTTVPHSGAIRLAQEVANAGHTAVYVIKLETSPHPSYHIDNVADRTKYLTYMHKLYKRYGLPHSKELASRVSDAELSECKI